MGNGIVLAAIGILGLLSIGVALLIYVFIAMLRAREWGMVLFLVVLASLAALAIAGTILAYGSLPA